MPLKFISDAKPIKVSLKPFQRLAVSKGRAGDGEA